MGDLNDAQIAVLVVAGLALVAGCAGAVWFWLDVRREKRRAAELARAREAVSGEPLVSGPPMRLPRPTTGWAFPMPPPAAKKYVPPVNGAVRVRPGGMVQATPRERWDLYVPPAPVDIPVIPSAPAVPSFDDFRGGGGRFGGGGATESWPGLEERAVAPVSESGVREVGSTDAPVSDGGGGGSFDGSVGGGGPE